MATVKLQRSTVDGVEQTADYYDAERDVYLTVPSYVVLAGSLNDAAKSLGFRLLGRREVVDSRAVVAELHEFRVPGSYWAVMA